jgi:predicted RNA-binding Zn-ribbon protein involved in translation (DUF1610 family)
VDESAPGSANFWSEGGAEQHAIRMAAMGRPWRAHVDFACPECGELLARCNEHLPTERICEACGEPVKLIGIGTARVEGARWYRCTSCGQLYMLRRDEFVKTGERAGTAEFGSLAQLLP